MSNFTDGDKTFDELICSTTPNKKPAVVFLSAFNFLLSLIASAGNSLILIALHKPSSLHPPSKVLLCSLAASDLCVGLILQPLVAILLTAVAVESKSLCRPMLGLSFPIGVVLFGVTLLTLTAISLERFLALELGTRFRQVVSFRKILALVICFWVLNVGMAALCVWKVFIFLWYGLMLILTCVVTSTFTYAKICASLRRCQTVVHHHSLSEEENETRLNIVRCKKTVSCSMWILMTLLACYLPYSIVTAVATQNGLTPALVLGWRFTSSIVFLNSSLNPFLYCWKIAEVRQAVKDMIRKSFSLG